MEPCSRKTGFPVLCPYCRKNSGRPNGRRRTKSKGVVQQVRCAACGRQFTLEPGNDLQLFVGQRLHLPGELLLRALALMVLGVPMNTIQRRLGIKGETLKGRMEHILDRGQWLDLRDELETRLRVPRFEAGNFDLLIVFGRGEDPAAYRCWAKEFRRMDPADRRQWLRTVARIMRRPVAAVTRDLKL